MLNNAIKNKLISEATNTFLKFKLIFTQKVHIIIIQQELDIYFNQKIRIMGDKIVNRQT